MLRVLSSTGMKISPLAPHFFHLVYSHPMTSNCLPLLGLRQDVPNVPTSHLTLPKAVSHRAKKVIFQRYASGQDTPLLKTSNEISCIQQQLQTLTRSVSPYAHPPHSN